MAASAVGGALGPSAEAIFLDYASHSREDVRRVFARYDADGDGSLSGVEMRHLLRDVGLVSAFDTAEDVSFLKKQLVAADRDGDGAVGFDEFTVYLNTVAAPRASTAKAGGKTFFATARETKKTGTKISFFAENHLFVADPCASPGTPELLAERPTRELSRHGTRSRIPTPPASYSRSETKKNACEREKISPGSATKFGFAVTVGSPATPATSASEGASARPPSSRLARLVTTPRTPLERIDVNARRDDTGANFFFATSPLAKSPSDAPPKTTERRFVSEDASSSPPETPSPLPAFAGPSRVHDAAGELLAFVRNLELENERLRSEANEARKRAEDAESLSRDALPFASEDGLSDGAETALSAALVSEAIPIQENKPASIVESRCLGLSTSPEVASIEKAVETFEAAAAILLETETESDADDAAESCVRVAAIDTRSNDFAISTRLPRSRSSRHAFLKRAAATFLVLLLLAAAAAALAFFYGAEVPVSQETCPAPSPITAARMGSRTSAPPRVEPNVILPRESFPAMTSWTF